MTTVQAVESAPAVAADDTDAIADQIATAIGASPKEITVELVHAGQRDVEYVVTLTCPVVPDSERPELRG